jgi:hypothetical protein
MIFAGVSPAEEVVVAVWGVFVWGRATLLL